MIQTWSEVVGTVINRSSDSVTLLCKGRITLQINYEELSRWSNLLLLGTLVAILTLDDGSVRVRILDQKEGAGKV